MRREERTASADHRASLRHLMWNKVGLIRDGAGLQEAFECLDRWAEPTADPDETANLWTVGRLVTAAAQIREESRGSHYRSDYPDSDPVWKRRLFWTYRSAGELPLQRATDPGFAERHLIREIA